MSGYVYQYFYEGQRPAKRDGETGVEYVFNVSADRKSSFPLSVFVSDKSLEKNVRQLSSTERYAVAKMALFQAFDRRPAPAEMTEEVRVSPEDVEAILATLDIG